MSCFLSTQVMANGVIQQAFNKLKPASTYTWSLPTPGAITLYKNYSTTPVTFIYTNDSGSDPVVIRCPLNDHLIRENYTYVCWLPTGESAKIELKSNYYSHGASGTYALIF